MKHEAGRTKKAIINTAAQVLPEIVNTVSGLILPRFLLLTFGSALTGLVSSINQFLTYLRKMEAGLSTASAVNLYKPLAQKDTEKTREVVSASRHFYRWVGILFSIGACLLAVLYPFLFRVDVEGYTWYKVTTLVLILAGSAAFNYFISASYQALLIADQRYYIVSLNMTVFGAVTIPCVLLAITTDNMLVVQGVNLLMAVLQSVALAVYTKRKYGEAVKYTRNFSKSSMNMRWDVFINELALLIETNCPIIILTAAVGLEAVSVYTVYNMIFVALQSVIRISRDALRPAFGQAWANGEEQLVRDCYSEFEWLIHFITVAAYTIAAITILPFIRLYTDGITDAEYIVPIFAFVACAAGAVRQLQIPASVMIGAAGQFKQTRWYIVGAAATAVILGTVGAIFYGLNGVMFGVLCGSLIKAISTICYINRQVLRRSLTVFFKRFLRGILVVLISVLPFVTFIHLEPTNYFWWIADAVGVSLWVLAVSAVNALLFDRTDMKLLIKRLFTAVKG